jgi:hypothetical protein
MMPYRRQILAASFRIAEKAEPDRWSVIITSMQTRAVLGR